MTGATVSHYEILERIGGGGMGVVYKARDVKLGRLVALKFLHSHRGASEDNKRRFLREARAAAAIDHPNLCTVYEIGEAEDGALFIAMALHEGETLRDRLERGPLPIAEAVNVAAQIAAGLAAAHKQGIIHRDVKPANIILAAGGGVKIVDFGIAKLSGGSRLTRAGTTVGTATYMAPEQFRGTEADPRTDVWALGVVLHEMVTGCLPFDGDPEQEMVKAILERRPLSMSSLRPGVPEPLERIAFHAMEKRPADRFASMELMEKDLRAAAAGLGSQPDDDVTHPVLPAPPLGRLGLGSKDGAGPVVAGRMIGGFRILDLIGGGGMGVVYRAEDTRLARTVALKFLPAELTRDPESKARFVQEARAASALDHPNLCTILELGETEDGRLYLAMPCYDGETLRRKIDRGPLPVAEAVDVAEQIARGLAKAHRHGIVHRDVKPANVIVTNDGVVKILDFGLAKLAGSAAVSRSGSSAGTPAYMSPEQARGEEVDSRSDLWSLGVVLYEMLNGRRPFRGDHEQAVIHSILNESPEPIARLRPETPPELARLTGRLLAKDPAGRFPSLDEPLAVLRTLRGKPFTGTLLTWLPPRRTRSRFWGALAAVLAGGALVAALAVWRSGGTGEALPVQGDFKRLTDEEGTETFPSLSPDGDEFVYVKATAPGNLNVYSQRVGGSNPRNLTADSPADDTHPAFSPDGHTLAFRSERDGGGIFLMGAAGESVRRLTGFGYDPAWSPDGRDIVVATEGVADPRTRRTASQLWRVDLATGARRLVTKGDAVQPSWSPNGQRIAYWGVPTGSAQRTLWTIPAAGGKPVAVTDDEHLNWSPAWSPDGQYLYFASNRGGSMNLWRIPLDQASGQVLGPPQPITAPSEWSGLPSLSRDGRRIVYATDEGRANLESAALDPVALVASAELHPITQGSRGVRSFDVSPDGRWLAFQASLPQEDLFVVPPEGGEPRQLTNDPYRDRHPRWSPDGSRLLFQSDRSGRYEIWSVRPDGGSLEQVTRTDGSSPIYPVWAPDGRRLACNVAVAGTALLDLSLPIGKRRLVPLPPIARGQLFNAVSWSPDGAWLAGQGEPRATPGIFLYSLAMKTYTRLTDRGQVPRWMPDGHTLLFRDEGRILAIDISTRAIRAVLSPPPHSSFTAHGVSPDGRTLFVSRVTEEGNICMLTLR